MSMNVWYLSDHPISVWEQLIVADSPSTKMDTRQSRNSAQLKECEKNKNKAKQGNKMYSRQEEQNKNKAF